jgi:hypothetical protein
MAPKTGAHQEMRYAPILEVREKSFPGE